MNIKLINKIDISKNVGTFELTFQNDDYFISFMLQFHKYKKDCHSFYIYNIDYKDKNINIITSRNIKECDAAIVFDTDCLNNEKRLGIESYTGYNSSIVEFFEPYIRVILIVSFIPYILSLPYKERKSLKIL